MTIQRALIVRPPFAEMIVQGRKPWEMRSGPTKIRERIGIIQQGTGLIIGEVDITDSEKPLSESDIEQNDFYDLHKIGDIELLKKWRHPWVMKNPTKYQTPVPYTHKQGAQKWVRLNMEDNQ